MNSDPALELPLAFRLQVKPLVMLGLNWTEVGYACAISASSALLTGIVIGVVFDSLMMILPVFLCCSILYFYLIGTSLARYKHNRPEGYYQQKTKLFFQKIGIGKTFITKSGFRDPRRSRRS